LISGDIGGAAKGIGNMLADVFKMAINNIKIVFIELPTTIINWLIPAMNDLADFLLKSLDPASGTGSVWDQVKPALLKLGAEILPPLWTSLKGLFSALFIKLPPVLGKLLWGVSTWLTTTIQDVFKSIGTAAWNAIVEVLITLAEKTAGLFGSKLKGAFDTLRNVLKIAPKLAADDANETAKMLEEQRAKQAAEKYILLVEFEYTLYLTLFK
jgi:hypothetical protein